MFWPVFVVAAGLLIALVGMVITFIINPPIYGFGDNAGGFIVDEKKEKRKVQFSKVGVWLLASGTFLQLAGTVWQVIRLACRG
jgi:hypothetical protein